MDISWRNDPDAMINPAELRPMPQAKAISGRRLLAARRTGLALVLAQAAGISGLVGKINAVDA